MTHIQTLGGLSQAAADSAYARLVGVQSTRTTDGAVVAGSHNPVDATSGNRTVTLADAASAGLLVAVSKKDSTANTVAISVAHLRDQGAQTFTLVGQYEAVIFESKADGTWWPVGDHKTKTYLDATYTQKPATDLGDWSLLRRDTSDATKGVSWTTSQEIVARALSWVILTDRNIGGVGDDSTDNAAALNAALAAFSSRGGTIYVPSGIFRFTTQPNVIPSNIRLVGAGKNASILRKAANFDFIRFVGASTSSRCQRGGMAELQLNGNTSTTGRLMMLTYADHLNFDNVWFNSNADSAFVATELWDTYFKGCEFEWTSGTDGFKPAVLLQSSATDSTNEVYFEQCRWESNKDGDVWIGTGGISSAYTLTTGSHPVYGVYFTDCKVECAFLRGPRIMYSSDVADVHWDRLYLAADGLDTGIATGRNLVEFTGLAFTTFSRVHVFINNSAAARVFRVFPGAYGHAIRDVYVDAVTAPTTGVIDFAGGNPYMKIANVRFKSGQSGTLYSGTVPSNVILEDQPTVKINTQTASYTLVLTDADTVIEENSASATTVTVPPNSSVAFPIGTVIEVHQYGAGQVTIAAGAGVTIRTAASLTTRAQYSTVTLRKRATDEWVLAGDAS